MTTAAQLLIDFIAQVKVGRIQDGARRAAALHALDTIRCGLADAEQEAPDRAVERRPAPSGCAPTSGTPTPCRRWSTRPSPGSAACTWW